MISSHIRSALGRALASQHPLYVQSLAENMLEPIDDAPRELGHEVGASVADAFVTIKAVARSATCLNAPSERENV